jgi:hypothetical protein
MRTDSSHRQLLIAGAGSALGGKRATPHLTFLALSSYLTLRCICTETNYNAQLNTLFPKPSQRGKQPSIPDM